MINTCPLCLFTSYQSDNDAVHIASEEEVARYLEESGARVPMRGVGLKEHPVGNAFSSLWPLLGGCPDYWLGLSKGVASNTSIRSAKG
jgi:hypothetical protein